MTLENDPAIERDDPTAAEPAVVDTPAAPAVATEPSPTPAPSDTPAAPASALEAALKAIGNRTESAAATAAKPADEATESAEPAKAAAEDTDQGEDLADVPKLSAEVFRALPKEARTAFNQLRKQVGTLRPDATRGQAVMAYLRESGVTPDEYMQMQDVGALMKRDPAKAREVLIQHIERIDAALGYKIPDDIQQDVDGGYLSEERARELSQTRARAAATERALAERDQATVGQNMASAVSAWEAQMRETDPDLGRKLPNIEREVRLALMERERAGRPVTTPEEAVAIAREALASVDKMLAPFKAQPSATPRAPSSAASAPAAVSQPTTVLDAAWAGLRRGRG